MCARESDWLTDGATAALLNAIGHTVHSAAGAHTHTHTHTHTHARAQTHSTADERKGLFLDPCIVSEIAKAPSEQSHFHFAAEGAFGGVLQLVGSGLNWLDSLGIPAPFVLKCVFLHESRATEGAEIQSASF